MQNHDLLLDALYSSHARALGLVVVVGAVLRRHQHHYQWCGSDIKGLQYHAIDMASVARDSETP